MKTCRQKFEDDYGYHTMSYDVIANGEKVVMIERDDRGVVIKVETKTIEEARHAWKSLASQGATEVPTF